MASKSFITSFSHAGTDRNYTYQKNSRIILLNYMCLTGIMVSLLFLVLNLTRQNNSIFLLNNLIGQFIFISTIFLNKKQIYKLAVWFCCLGFLIFINLIALLNGPESGAVYMNLVICISSLLFFEKRQDIFLLSSLSFIAFLACHYIYSNHPISIENKNIQIYFYVYSTALFVACYIIVWRYKKEIVKYNFMLLEQKNQLYVKNKEISESMVYARNIQRTILKFDPKLEQKLTEVFILFKPKDIVSGDFYWINEVDDKIIGCVADCTGHGIPGALMSMIGTTLIRDAVVEKKMTDPAKILETIRIGIIKILRQTDEGMASKDGMDISLCVYNHKTKALDFAGANNNCYVIRGNELIELKASKLPIGIYPGEEQTFASSSLQLVKGDCLYMFTDGYADQFGGPNGKKYKKKNLLGLLLKHSSLPMSHQRKILETEFNTWKNTIEQTDDVTIFGVRA